jgi:transposase
MNDRFDHKLEHKLETKPETVEDAVVAVRRFEVITGTGRRRQWSSEDRTRILMESLVPGANISAVARRHGMSPQQLFGWRREARDLFTQGEVAAGPPVKDVAPALPARGGKPTQPAFAPVVIAPATQKFLPSAPPPVSPPLASIEITVGEAIVRLSGTVDAAALAVVMNALRRTS